MRMILLSQIFKFGLPLVALAAVTGCSPDYSPNTYNAAAVQQANKVDSAVVVGFRQVSISAAGTVGAVTGGAAGGILGAQVGPNNTASALGAVGGGIVGSLLGTSIEHATADTTGWEYIVQKPNGDLLSVTQREPQPIPLGQKVLVIAGSQARIIPDFRVAKDLPKDAEKDKPAEKPGVAAAPVPQPAAVIPPWSVVPMSPPSSAPAEPAAAPVEPASAIVPPPSIPATPLPAPDATAAPVPLAPATPSDPTPPPS
jgi:outer membrane lipoprotein SlyB